MVNKIPAVFKKDEDTAIISKLVVTEQTYSRTPSTDDFIEVSKYTAMKNESSNTILSMFPDIGLGIEIITSSVLSPNDMINNELLISIKDLPLPMETISAVMKHISDTIDNEYDVSNELDNMLLESYYTKGAYITAVIPEASLDEIINYKSYNEVSIESMGWDKSINILGDSNNTISLESFKIDDKNYNNVSITNDLVTFTDNPNILQYTELVKLKQSNETANLYGDSNEDLQLDDIFKSYLEYTHNDVKDIIVVKNDNQTVRQSIGKPLVLPLPTESVIPIHIPGKPSEHLAYFVLLNEHGVPLDNSKTWSESEEQQRLDSLTKSSLMDRSKNNLSSFISKIPTIHEMENIYSDIFNKEITNTLNNSTYGGISEVTNINHIYTTMLYRVLRKQRTRILFLDKSVVSFMAFEYRTNGTGKSQLEKLETLSSLRGIANMTRVMANIKNSIPTTVIDVTLDEKDPDPEKTVEMVIDEVTKSRALQIPVGLRTMNDLVEWGRKVGYVFNFKHDTRLPNMVINYTDVMGEKAEPDVGIDDKYKKDMLNAVGLTPEKIDSAYSGRFATTEILNDILLVKRIIKIQNKFGKLLTNHIKTLLTNDYTFRKEMGDIFKKNMRRVRIVSKRNDAVVKYEKKFIDYLVRTTISNLEVKLPRPNYEANDNLAKHFSDYKSSVEEYVEIIFSSDALPNTLVGDISEDLDEFKTAITNTVLRKWAVENNYLTEVLDIVSNGKDVKSAILEEYGDYSEMMLKTILQFLKKNEKVKKRANKMYGKLEDIQDTTDEFETDDEDSNRIDTGSGDEPPKPPNVHK